MVEDQILSASEAAKLLGVSAQRVRQMISSGQLPARRSSAGWLIPRRAIISRAENSHRGRPAGPRTAWAAIALLAAGQSNEINAGNTKVDLHAITDRRLRHRALHILRDLPDPDENPKPWRRLLASRGDVRHFWVHPGVLQRIADDARVSIGGAAAAAHAGEGLSGGKSYKEFYASAADINELIKEYRMRDDSSGQVIFRVVPVEVPADIAPKWGQRVSAPAAAADLLDEADIRANRVAINQLKVFRKGLDESYIRSAAQATTKSIST